MIKGNDEKHCEIGRSNGIVMRDAAMEGHGIALLATFVVHDALKRKWLLEVNVDAEPELATIIIAYPKDRRVSAKVLAITAHLRAAFGNRPVGIEPLSVATASRKPIANPATKRADGPNSPGG
jgi:DNA-binding transcriptional LysR family regulator